MPKSKIIFLIVLFVFISGLFTAGTTNTAPDTGKYPDFIRITDTPCCLECSYSLPYCYNYKISNMNDAIKVTGWNFDNGLIKGTAVANIDAILITKMCFQLSLTSAYLLTDEELDLEAEFDFNVKISSNKNVKSRCIEETESSVSYRSFLLNGDLTSDPIPEVINQLAEDIQSSIKYSVYRAVYESFEGPLSSGNEKNIYCTESQSDFEANESPCPCY